MAEDVGTRIKRLRLECGLTLQAVADELGLTPAAISHWESGRVIPKGRKLQVLSKLLGANVGEIGDPRVPSARSKPSAITRIDAIRLDAQRQIATEMGCSPHRVRLILTIEPD